MKLFMSLLLVLIGLCFCELGAGYAVDVDEPRGGPTVATLGQLAAESVAESLVDRRLELCKSNVPGLMPDLIQEAKDSYLLCRVLVEHTELPVPEEVVKAWLVPHREMCGYLRVHRPSSEREVGAILVSVAMWKNGRGVKRFPTNARRLLAFLEGQERADVYFELGRAYLEGWGDSIETHLWRLPNHEKAFEWFTKAAEQDHAGAMFELGRMHSNSLETLDGTPNYGEAFNCFTKAAERDHLGAICQLAYMHLHGWNPRDKKWDRPVLEDKVGLGLLDRAIARGSGLAMCKLADQIGYILRKKESKKLPQWCSEKERVRLYTEAAARGVSEARRKQLWT